MKEPKNYKLAVELPEDLSKFSFVFTVSGDDFEENFDLRKHLKDPSTLQSLAAMFYSAGLANHAKEGGEFSHVDVFVSGMGAGMNAAAVDNAAEQAAKGDPREVWQLMEQALYAVTVCDESDPQAVADLVQKAKALAAHSEFPSILAFVQANAHDVFTPPIVEPH